jgi:hypothetical protein
MRIDSTRRNPPPAAPAPAPPDASGFAASMKKAGSEQQARAARQARREPANAVAVDDTRNPPAGCGPVLIQQAFDRANDQSGSGADGSDSIIDQLNGLGLDDDVDCAGWADELAPLSANDGLFEVLLPGGHRLSVAVSSSAQQTCFLLSASSEDVQQRLKRKKMELEQQLQRRIGKAVAVTVL